MQRKTLLPSECPIARGLEQVGEWWSILLMRDALQGLKRFDEFARSLDIAPSMLTRRLNSLVDAGMLQKVPYSQRPLRYEYIPTDKVKDFLVVLMAFVSWGNKHLAPEGESVQMVDRDSGQRLQLSFTTTPEVQSLPLDRCTVRPGPAASAAMRDRLHNI
ncbi:winged helix-turn-helix transcriptional regulator [Halopseudomonas sp.]|uniref:winged helix-turn-helix transcriptional regulator n=1 Tax=Halopseudomonas sp. TaxID=2901191 RepID=UPI003001AF04